MIWRIEGKETLTRSPAVRARARWKTEKDGFDVLNWVLKVAMKKR